MSTLTDLQRSTIVAEALTWLRTPWHHGARLKGVGVDCAQILVAVYNDADIVENFYPEKYPIDWNLHKEDQRFMNYLLRYTEKTEVPLPADIAMFRYGRQPAHGAIVVQWPLIIHAYRPERMVVLTDLSTHPLMNRLVGCFTFKGLKK